jgi:hypothetical protein
MPVSRRNKDTSSKSRSRLCRPSPGAGPYGRARSPSRSGPRRAWNESVGVAYFFPRMRFIFVPHTGQVPCAALLPFASSTSCPSNVCFSRHFTQ